MTLATSLEKGVQPSLKRDLEVRGFEIQAQLRSNGLETLIKKGDRSMPWNAKAEAGRLGPGIPNRDFWASPKEGIDQAGCVYTAQGFEFDYIGVIFGPDLVYRPMDAGRAGRRHESRDRMIASVLRE